ncbi:phosphoglycolate phosphatase [Serratia marcescens]|uniref:phosphoglycolate phosphatase n=1 Tax=Serratia marcescens TaxID=615 RepID=UPI001F4001CC|nr:phosphoglycolate phosphatase [Serratia marcescens]
MDSWAESDIFYPSQNAETPNKQEPSQEMQATGFVPTYIDAAGNLVIGDAITAQHINFILCELFRRYRELQQRLAALEGGGTSPSNRTVLVTEFGEKLTTEQGA